MRKATRRAIDLVERLREAADVVDLLGRGERLDGGTVGGGVAAEAERRLVHLDRLAVELDRALDRLGRERQRADLEGVADQEDVGGDRVAEERAGDAAWRRRNGTCRRRRRRAIARLSRSVGSVKSTLRVKSPGRNSARFTTMSVWPGLTAASTFLVPATTMSPPMTSSAEAAATRMAWMSSGSLAMRMWL